MAQGPPASQGEEPNVRPYAPPTTMPASELEPRLTIRPADIARWKAAVERLGKQVPIVDPWTTTFLGIAMGVIVGIVGTYATTDRPEPLLVMVLWVSFIAALLLTLTTYLQHRAHKNRTEDDADVLCADIDSIAKERIMTRPEARTQESRDRLVELLSRSPDAVNVRMRRRRSAPGEDPSAGGSG